MTRAKPRFCASYGTAMMDPTPPDVRSTLDEILHGLRAIRSAVESLSNF
jgi:hypothetical protein